MSAFITKMMRCAQSATDDCNASVCNRHRNSRTIQFLLFAFVADALLVLVEIVAGLSLLRDIQNHPWLYGYIFLGTMAAFSFFGAMIGCREDQLEHLALRDSLTGLFNSRYMWARLDEQWAAGKRDDTVSSLILLDLDFFKRVNDEHGHPVGDELLKRVGHALQIVARRSDTVARIGGEEFLFFLPNTSVTEAAAIAERIRHTISLLSIPTDRKRQMNITVSAGVAGTKDYKAISPQDLYALADKALYRAKNQGRNRVVIDSKSDQDT